MPRPTNHRASIPRTLQDRPQLSSSHQTDSQQRYYSPQHHIAVALPHHIKAIYLYSYPPLTCAWSHNHSTILSPPTARSRHRHSPSTSIRSGTSALLPARLWSREQDIHRACTDHSHQLDYSTQVPDFKICPCSLTLRLYLELRRFVAPSPSSFRSHLYFHSIRVPNSANKRQFYGRGPASRSFNIFQDDRPPGNIGLSVDLI